MRKMTTGAAGKPGYVLALEAAYGAPSCQGFGSAVFFERASADDELEALAKKYYRTFVGDNWEAWGAETWLGPWKEVYVRPGDADHNIEAELRAIRDVQTQVQVSMILDVVQDASAARKALAGAYDAAEVVDLRAYDIGDGAAMSGLLLAGRRQNGEATFLVFLLD